MTPLIQGNKALREKNYHQAIAHYIKALIATPGLSKTIAQNIKIARHKIKAQQVVDTKPRVAVCGWALSHSSADRVYTLAKLYETFAEVEIIGSIFPQHGSKIWEPIRGSSISIHSFIVNDESQFLDQAIRLVIEHPYDIVHLSKPRMPNIFIGLLYRLIWEAKVLVDIDDEELAHVGADTPIKIKDYLKNHASLPVLKELDGVEWTQLAVGMAQGFDGVTVSNSVLQQRYGGRVIRHARDENCYQPSVELKRRSREKFAIPLDQKVVLFCGIPDKGNGLIKTAKAIATLKCDGVIFVIAGDFSDNKLKQALQAIEGVDYRFIANQPADSIPEVMAVGDICILLQDPTSAVSKFQLPAKLSDALGMGLVVLAHESPVYADIAEQGGIITVSNKDLANTLQTLITDDAHCQQVSAIAHDVFKTEISYTKNRHRLQQLVACQNQDDVLYGVTPLFTAYKSLHALRNLLDKDKSSSSGLLGDIMTVESGAGSVSGHKHPQGKSNNPVPHKNNRDLKAKTQNKPKLVAVRQNIPVHSQAGVHEYIEDMPTILVCGHIAGDKLFGSERSLIDILDAFCTLKYNVIVSIPSRANGQYLNALIERSHKLIVFRYGWWRDNNSINDSVVAVFSNIIAEYKVNAVHANTIMLREPLVAAKRLDIPAVVHVRELILHDESLLKLINVPAKMIVEQIIESSDYLIANSEATADGFKKSHGYKVIPNTVDIELFDIPNKIESNNIKVGLISSNLPKKGIFDFIEIATLLYNEIPEVKFYLIGSVNEHTDLLKQKQVAGDIPSNVVFAGYYENPLNAIAEVNIVLSLSNFQESFGRTILEAMAARRAVLVYDWGALPELVENGKNGFIVPFRDIAATTSQLKEMCLNPSLLVAMGEHGRKRAVEIYAKAHYAEKMKYAYNDIFNRAKKQLILPARNISKASPLGGRPKIAYFLWHFPVPSETFVLNELRMLVQQGYDVCVFCRQSPYKDFTPDFIIEWERVDSPEALAMRLTETKRDVVHSHFTYPTVTDMVWPACEIAEVNFTFIAHAQDIFRYANDKKNKIGEITQSDFCQKLFVPAHFHRDYVEERGVLARKICINPNGIDASLYVQAWQAQRAARPFKSVCAIHRFTEKKGLEYLIQAGKRLANSGIHIHIYGYGDLEDSYKSIIAEAQLKNVYIHGPVKGRDEMIHIFNQSDLFACPSVRAVDGDMDGIPTVLMEAMASGIPVLTTDISGIPNLVQHNVTGFVCKPTPESIAEVIEYYYALPDTHVEAVIEDAAKVIKKDYDVSKLMLGLTRVWEQKTVDIIIVSWNNIPELSEVVRRIFKYTSLPFHLIICDNGSDRNGMANLCRIYAENDSVTVILNRDNALVGPGTNICMQHSWSDYAVYVCGKEGFVLNYGWEKSLINYMQENQDVGLAGSIGYAPDYLYGYQYPDAIPEFPKFRNKNFAAENQKRRFGHIQGGFFVIRRKMYEEIGGFSDAVPHNYTDVEYSYYVESCGWRLGAAPNLLALFNKSRPGLFSRIDESIYATHPPRLEDLPNLDLIAQRKVCRCNICHWMGKVFLESKICPQCTSAPEDRSLFHFLASSTLTYRRLPAVGINVRSAMGGFWKEQFQGMMFDGFDFIKELKDIGCLDFNDGSVKLIYLNQIFDGSDTDYVVIGEIDRLLSEEGILLIRQTNDQTKNKLSKEYLKEIMKDYNFSYFEDVRYSSAVIHFDWNNLLVCRKIEPSLCVS